MMSSIKKGTGVSERSPDRKSPQRDGESASRAPQDTASEDAIAPAADFRLVIEPDATGEDYVYKLIDRATGKVVSERGRDQVASLAEGPEYRAGTVISTKA